MSRRYFKSKSGPVFTQGRVQHALFGGGCVVVFGGVSWLITRNIGDGAQWGFLVAFGFGLAWEFLTGWFVENFEFARKWAHPFGDFIDFFSYHVGAIVIGAPLIWWLK